MFSRSKCQIRNISNVQSVIFYNFDFNQTSGSRSTLICSLIASHPCLTTFESHCQSRCHNNLWFAWLPQVLGRPVYFRSHSPWKEFWHPPHGYGKRPYFLPFLLTPSVKRMFWSIFLSLRCAAMPGCASVSYECTNFMFCTLSALFCICPQIFRISPAIWNIGVGPNFFPAQNFSNLKLYNFCSTVKYKLHRGQFGTCFDFPVE